MCPVNLTPANSCHIPNVLEIETDSYFLPLINCCIVVYCTDSRRKIVKSDINFKKYVFIGGFPVLFDI